MTTRAELRIKVFADGADLGTMLELAADPLIRGFTTNPTLMRRAGVVDYEAFARRVLQEITSVPISFEVFADEFDEMERQARLIAALGTNVHVKIPVTNTRGEPATELIHRLSGDGIKLNVTALLTLEQVRSVAEALGGGAPAFISVFAGRIADTGYDPLPLMREALAVIARHPGPELIWASPREVLNVVQADSIGCHIITITSDLLRKLDLLGRDLGDYSLETVRMFHGDAAAAGFSI